MTRTRVAIMLLGLGLLGACADTSTALPPDDMALFNKMPLIKATPISVGEKLFHDRNLSRLENQSCASCHTGNWGFFGPDDETITAIANSFFEGSIRDRFGDRKPPSAAYASFSPPLRWDTREGTYRGGSFWDGRATGGRGITAIAVQAMGPFQSSPEHAFSPVCVLWEVSQSDYRAEFEAVSNFKLSSIPFGKVAPDMDAYCHNPDPDFDFPPNPYPPNFTSRERDALKVGYTLVGNTIGAFEHSPLVNRFSSRFDRSDLTAEERAGEALFFGASGCDKCHSGGNPELFTDFSYYNIGVPRNPFNPAGADWKDPGLGGFLALGFDRARAQQMMGFFKSPGLRNVDKRVNNGARTYMHNGALVSLEQVVHFYNTRDVRSCSALGIPEAGSVLPTGPGDTRANACWPAPDFPQTVVRDLGGGIRGVLGDLRLTPQEEARIVAFMKTLTDR
jgi:cytochrome c peroxidase